MRRPVKQMLRTDIFACGVIYVVWCLFFSNALQLNVGVSRDSNGHLNGKLYVRSSFMTFQCEILREGLNDSVRVKRALGNSFASQGLSPSITIYNSTWRKTFSFSSSTWDLESAVWNISLAKEAFSFTNGVTEMWSATVQLDSQTGLLQVQTVILDIQREPLLNKGFGESVQNSTWDLQNSPLSPVQSPCSLVVMVIGATDSVQGIILAVTFNAFTVGSTTYWAVTPQLCEDYNINGCDQFHLVDLTLTSRYLLLLTSGGIFKVDLLKMDLKAHYSFVSIPQITDWMNWRLLYTPVSCKSERDTSDDYEEIVFLQSTDDTNKHVFWSSSQYTSWTLLYTPLPSSRLSTVAYNWQSRTLICAYQEEHSIKSINFAVNILSNGRSGLLKFQSPSVVFPSSFNAVGTCIHPVTVETFIYGNQVWGSKDGGATFQRVYIDVDISEDDIINCVFGIRNSWIVMETKSHKILFKKEGNRRLSLINTISSPSSTITIDSLGNLLKVITFGSQQDLSVYTINLQAELRKVKELSGGKFAFQRIDQHLGILLGYRSDSPILSKGMEGRLLANDRLQAQFQLQEVFQAKDGSTFITYATVDIKSLFTELTETYHCKVVYTPITNESCYLRLHCSESSDAAWTEQDVGKTVLVQAFSSFLITGYLNQSHVVAAPTFSSFLTGVEEHIICADEWTFLDLRPYFNQQMPDEVLYVNQTGSEADTHLSENHSFNFTVTHLGLSVITSTGGGYVEDVKNNSHITLSNVSGILSYELDPGEWTLADTSEGAQWYFVEGACHHVLELDDEALQFQTRYLDVGDDFSFSALASTTDGSLQSGWVISARVSNPDILHIVTETWRDKFGSEVIDITVRHRMYGKGSSSVTVSIPAASSLCNHTSYTLMFHCSCPPSKHLHYIYEPRLTDHVFLYRNPVDYKEHPLLTTLEPNYRPPSHRGIAIPLSDNIYNADPNHTRPRDYYKVSIESGRYKQCQGKGNRAECGCTDGMRLSSLAKNSDCRERAYRLLHPGKVVLKFAILEHGKEDIPVKEPLIILLREINDRMDFDDDDPSSPSIEKMKSELFADSEWKLYNSTAISLILRGSGLYHFEASILEGFSYCDLKDEFQFYVDLAPLPKPTISIVIAMVIILMGTVIFIGYLNYLNTTHHRPMVRRMLSQCTINQKQD